MADDERRTPKVFSKEITTEKIIIFSLSAAIVLLVLLKRDVELTLVVVKMNLKERPELVGVMLLGLALALIYVTCRWLIRTYEEFQVVLDEVPDAPQKIEELYSEIKNFLKPNTWTDFQTWGDQNLCRLEQARVDWQTELEKTVSRLEGKQPGPSDIRSGMLERQALQGPFVAANEFQSVLAKFQSFIVDQEANLKNLKDAADGLQSIAQSIQSSRKASLFRFWVLDITVPGLTSAAALVIVFLQHQIVFAGLKYMLTQLSLSS